MPHSTMPNLQGEHAEHRPAAPGATRDPAVIAGTDRVAKLLTAQGWSGSYRLFLPSGPTGVYTVFTYPDRPAGQRTLYVDRYSLRPIGPEVRYAEYGLVGRAVESGVQLHMGNYFGRANQWLMLVPCLAIWILVISGVAMWWKRRPAGRVGAPPPLSGARMGGLLASLVVAGMVLPLFGASLLMIGMIDRLVTSFWRWRTPSACATARRLSFSGRRSLSAATGLPHPVPPNWRGAENPCRKSYYRYGTGSRYCHRATTQGREAGRQSAGRPPSAR